MACPYGVRYLNEEERVVEKCTLCEQKVAQGELPQCVAQCGGRARFFGDLDAGFEAMVGPAVRFGGDRGYSALAEQARVSLLDDVDPFDDSDVYHLPDVGNGPSFAYILRDMTWRGGE